MKNLNRPQSRKAILVCVNFKRDADFEELVNEGISLVESAGYDIESILKVNRLSVDRKFFVGTGKLEEIKALCAMINVGTVVINHNISPVQERNLEMALNLPVIDRTRLILDIFAQRVRSNEGVLQVELAIQTHQLSRLVRRWSHLERQKGGIGLRGGPGEKQMELDRRMIVDKIKTLKSRLKLAIKQRQTQRKSRLKRSVFSASLVGYTNTGKSTLFNVLTKANVYAENRLFATLQTTSRKFFLGDNKEIVLSDTVGFIRDLPHTLVASFRATLEETIYSDLLLHVVDVSHALKERQILDVDKVLVEVGASDLPRLIIYNKIDLKAGLQPRIEYDDLGEPIAVYISAMKKIGLDILRQAISEKMEWLINKNVSHEGVTYEPWKD